MRLPLLASLLCTSAFAAEIAPASSQYDQQGTVPVAPTITTAPAAPVMFSRKIWPRVELADGRVLELVRVSAEDGTTVTLIHSGGIAKVDKRALPEELAKLHPYDLTSDRPAAPARPVVVVRTPPVYQAPQSSSSGTMRIIRPDMDVPITQTTQMARPVPAPASPAPTATNTLTDAIEAAVKARARRYFETEKKNGSGHTLTFGMVSELSEPREIPGWSNQWEVKGVAGYKVYDSVGWGSFKPYSTNFTAVVDTTPGKRITVLRFDER